jgi:D-alanyl-lipoteichoic acid acyltransferase DltB (MBOAT superfamily)
MRNGRGTLVISEKPCFGMDWDPIAAAPTFSAFAAVLAGFVFACIVVVAADRARGDRTNTLLLFLAGFFCLSVASYTDAVSSGEVVCVRGWTAMMFTSSLLGVGAGSVFCGLAWMLGDFADEQEAAQHRPVSVFMDACAYCVAAIVVLMLSITAQGYLLDLARVGPVPWWLSWVGWIYLLLALIAIAAIGLGRRRRPRQTAAQVVRAAIVVLMFAVFTLVSLAIVTSQPAEAWRSVPSWVAIVSTTIPLVSSAAVLLTLLNTLPIHHNEARIAAPNKLPRTPDSLRQPNHSGPQAT